LTSILPDPATPRVVATPRAASRRPSSAADALLVMAPLEIGAAKFDVLPEPARWRALHARATAASGSVRSTSLAHSEQSLAVLGYLKPGASAYERLQLAGRMLKETAERAPRSIELASLANAPAASADLEALLSAALARAFELPSYRKRPPKPPPHLATIELRAAADGAALAPAQLARSTATARGNNLARWLTALPPNVLDARSYRRALGTLARRHGLELRWYDERTLERLGAGAFLAVSAGNAERTAGIARLRYRPRRGVRRPDVALIGKGILFDTGGTNLKPHRGMLDMHIDMAGSAVALGSLIALAELGAPLAVDAWLAITENRTGPRAYRPQDVVVAANGVSIQVIHTDAEGRMVLADTLALAARERPRLMLDYATLTGACVVALTERLSGVFTNDESLIGPLLAAGRASGERVWHFPMDEDFDAELESKVADLLQCAVEGKGDHILAARFLQHFVPAEIPWAHLDLSAAMRSGGLAHIGTDITGFGVRYTLELLLGQDVLARPGARPATRPGARP
jgi:leucyl aminopeptidase